MTKLLTLVTTGKSNIIHLQCVCIELIGVFLFISADFFSVFSLCLSLQENSWVNIVPHFREPKMRKIIQLIQLVSLHLINLEVIYPSHESFRYTDLICAASAKLSSQL